MSPRNRQFVRDNQRLLVYVRRLRSTIGQATYIDWRNNLLDLNRHWRGLEPR